MSTIPVPIGERWRTRLRRALSAIALICCFSILGTGHAASSGPVSEYQVKAVFLFQFTQFVEWPAQAFADSRAPLVIGVLGDDPFGPYLDDVVRGEATHGHPIEVRRFRSIDQINGCQILFISASERARWSSIFAALRGRSVLTVSDVGGFTRSNGMVLLAMTNGRIRLKVNVGAAKAESLTISSKLLRSAEIVASAEH